MIYSNTTIFVTNKIKFAFTELLHISPVWVTISLITHLASLMMKKNMSGNFVKVRYFLIKIFMLKCVNYSLCY